MADQDKPTQNRTSPSVGGTSTPIAGSSMGTGDKDPVVSEEAETQSNPSSNVLTAEDRESDSDDSNPDAPEHGGYGRPV